MRKVYGVASTGVMLTVLAAVHTGCWSTYDDYYLPLTNPALADAGTEGGNGGHDGGTDGGDGGEGGPPASCIPRENTAAVADTCGIFVSSSEGSDTTGKGTQAQPYKTLTKALSEAKAQPVYACGEAFSEAVTISASVELYGALACTKGWVYDASTKTQLTAGADKVPLTLTSSASASAVYDFAITAVDATVVAGSSIAVLDDQADLTLERVDVVAGAGKQGAAGTPQNQATTPTTADGQPGSDDATCNMVGPIPGGNGGKNTCGMTDTSGGIGGQGVAGTTGGNGNPGNPMMTPGNAGSGETSSASCNASDPKGADGTVVGASGTGARGIGDVSSSGYTGATGALGGTGSPGQGGGGGGGARQCDAMGMFAGPSGGGGGAGGCGGGPGTPGQSGGSSLGILALSAKLTLANVTITTQAGGDGGMGGDGQLGAPGGKPGTAVGANACDGGKGGQGAQGGPGGGGAGGHSVGIALKGGKLPDVSTTTITPGSPGMGGAGGDMDMTAQTKGDNGMACRTLDFTNPASPTACAM